MDPIPSKSKIMTVLRVTSGNFLEMFDFIVFGFYASAIAKAYFPGGNEFASLMLTFMTVFGAGFLMRPLGAIVLGAYIDHHGRRKGLILTLTMMAIGTIADRVDSGLRDDRCVGADHRVARASAARLLGRRGTGRRLGVSRPRSRPRATRASTVRWQSGSQQVAVVFAALIGVVLNQILPPDQMTSWGWRVPFFIGCLIVPFLFMHERS